MAGSHDLQGIKTLQRQDQNVDIRWVNQCSHQADS